MRLFAAMLGLVACGCLSARPTVSGPPRLDWSANGRWVHVDHVAPSQVALFEASRKGWLATLARDAEWHPDGRPLFWSGTHGAARLYLTFYPYATWADLEARAAVVRATEAEVGKQAVEDYDRGDAALVAPHRSELWRRVSEMDLGPSQAPSELTARRLVVELRQMPVGAAGAALDPLWTAVQQALAAGHTGARAQTWWSAYGSGDLVVLWTSSDERPARGLSVLSETPQGIGCVEVAVVTAVARASLTCAPFTLGASSRGHYGRREGPFPSRWHGVSTCLHGYPDGGTDSGRRSQPRASDSDVRRCRGPFWLATVEHERENADTVGWGPRRTMSARQATALAAFRRRLGRRVDAPRSRAVVGVRSPVAVGKLERPVLAYALPIAVYARLYRRAVSVRVAREPGSGHCLGTGLRVRGYRNGRACSRGGVGRVASWIPLAGNEEEQGGNGGHPRG